MSILGKEDFRIQNAENFIKRTQGLKRPRDMDKITREFFLYSEELGKVGERITCSGNYKYISRKITNDIMNQTWKTSFKLLQISSAMA